jgi:ATP-dependent Clp protease ATP-binding subunit ClpA
MFERFSDRARKVMALANQEAQRFNHEYIGTEHILLGLVKEGTGVGAQVLKEKGVDLLRVRAEVEKLVRRSPDILQLGKIPQTPRAKKVIEYAVEESRNLGHNYVGTEHLLLGLIRENEGVANRVLTILGLELDEVRKEVQRALNSGEEVSPELTDAARKVLAYANGEALRFNHEYIGTEHILLGLLREGSNLDAKALIRVGVDLARARAEIGKLVRRGPDTNPELSGLPQTPRAKKVVERAKEESKKLGHHYVGPEHLLLGLIGDDDGVAAQVLTNLGVVLEDLRQEVLNGMGAGGERGNSQALPLPPLSPATHIVIYHASKEAKNLKHRSVGPEHILLGLIHDPDEPAAEALAKLGMDLDKLRAELLRLLGG